LIALKPKSFYSYSLFADKQYRSDDKKSQQQIEKSTFRFVTRRHFTSSKITNTFNVSKLETYIAGKTPARQTVIINIMISCK
jgi:hypothetical protein